MIVDKISYVQTVHKIEMIQSRHRVFLQNIWQFPIQYLNVLK